MTGTTAAATGVLVHDAPHPHVFTRAEVGWLAWLEPLPVGELTERHYEGLVDRGRANSDYFRLLARDGRVWRRP